jgi:hypothetical protein
MGQTLPGSGWWTGTQIQNVSASAATVNVQLFDASSATTFSTDHNIPAGGALTLLPSALGVNSAFIGSGVVSSDQELRAIVNVTNRATAGLGVAGGLAAGQYQGTNQGSTTLSFPLVKNNHFGKTTSFYIQNAGASAATATAVFVLPSGVYTYTTPSIGVGKMVTFSAADARNAGNAAPPSGNGVVGSLSVTSGQAMAGVVLEYIQGENPATVVQATRGFAASEAGTNVYAPIIKNNYFNRFTGLQVQNASGSPVNITVNYTALASGSCAGGSFQDSANNVAPGASATFVHLTGSGTTLPNGCLASATVVGTGNVLAIVNEAYTSGFLSANPGRAQEATTYFAIPAATATTKISVPLFKEDSFNKGTGLQVQNVGGGTANVTLTFTGPTGTYTSVPQSIPAGSSMTFIDVRKKAASFWSGTAMTPGALGCTGTGGEAGNICGANGVFGVIVTSNQPIAAIANESTYPNTAPRISQDKNNYEGFNLAP